MAVGDNDFAVRSVAVNRVDAPLAQVEIEQTGAFLAGCRSLAWSCRCHRLPSFLASRHELPYAASSLSMRLLACLSSRSYIRNDAGGPQPIDVACTESELIQDFLGVLANAGRAPSRLLGHAMDLDRTADRRGQFLAGAFERNDDVVRPQLRIVDDIQWIPHGTECHVDFAEHLIPMRHRLRGEDAFKNGGEL